VKGGGGAYCRNVTANAKKRQCNNKTTKNMNRNANASAKSKDVHPYAQSRPMQHICFCSDAQKILPS